MTALAWWPLVGLLVAPALVWLHRRASPRGDHLFTAFFLLERGSASESAGRRLRAPWLLAARLGAVATLVVAALGLSAQLDAGTVVVATGPFTADPAWSGPVTVIRAGRPPAVVTGPVAPVEGPVDVAAAFLLARSVAPGARVVRPADGRTPDRIRGAGAALDGADVVVTAAADVAPELVVDGARHPLVDRGPDWVVTGRFRAGPAWVEAAGAPPWAICLPDARPLRVAERGWPPAVEAVLAVLPHLERVADDDAEWRVGDTAGSGTEWAPFAPATVDFAFAAPGVGSAAPLFFADPALPPPGATAQRWTRLAEGAPALYAGDAVVVDRQEGRAGAQRRFGLALTDTDLPETGGWPVIFAEAALADRAARGRCREQPPGVALAVQAGAPIIVESPSGARREVAPRDGHAVIDGLDERGVYTLRSGGVEAHVVVQPDRAAATDAPPLATRAQRAPPMRGFAWLALGLLGVVLVLARRGDSPLLWLAIALSVGVALDLRLGGGAPGPVVLAVDHSGSMPPAQTAAAVARAAALAGPDCVRVDGAGEVSRVGRCDAPIASFAGRTDSAGLLAAALAAAGDSGVVVWIPDGRGGPPVAGPVPIFTIPVAGGPDARVLSGRAVRVGESVFVQAEVEAQGVERVAVRLGPARLDVDLPGDRARTVHAVLEQASETVTVAVAAEGDWQPANDRLVLPVDGDGPPTAVVVGGGAAPWARAAGMRVVERPAAALAVAGRQLAAARAMFVHDQPVAALSPAVLDRVRRWVEAGGLLVLAGRERAFGPGGWAGTAIDAISPLAADPRPPGRGVVALALLVDRSGSMDAAAGGVGVAGLGGLVARLAGALSPEDELAVVAFGARPTVLLPPTPVARVTRVPSPASTRGGTRLGPALAEAARLLATSAASRKVAVVISDGEFGEADLDALAAPLAALRAAGVTVYGVRLGDAPAGVLSQVAEATGGQTQRARGGAVAGFAAAAAMGGPDGLLAGAGAVQVGASWQVRVGGPPPAVAGRARVRARAPARVLARAAGEPLLAEWQVGYGRVIALATDRWSLAPDQWSALLSPAAAPRPREVTLRVEGDRLRFHGPIDAAPPTGPARILSEGRWHTRAWRPTGPGRAEAELPPGPPAVLSVNTPTSAGAVVARISRPVDRELRRVGPDLRALRAQAEITGGRLGGPEVVRAARAARRPGGGWPLAPWLALLSLLALLVDTGLWAGVGSRVHLGRWLRANPERPAHARSSRR